MELPMPRLPLSGGESAPSPEPLRVLYIVWANQAWPFFEWICRALHGRGYHFTFLLMNAGESPLAPGLREAGVPFHQIRFRGRSDLPRAAWEIRRFCLAGRFDLVHAHFVNSCLAGLAGSALAGIPIRVHTRHHSSQHRFSHRKLWELPFDSINNALSTHIIAPCLDVRRKLIEEGVPESAISVIHHGYDLDSFRNVSEERVLRLRERYGIPPGAPTIGVISRFIRTKGVEYVVEAFRRLRDTHPTARLVVANASGPWAVEVRKSLRRLPAGSYIEIPFEPDVFALYRLFDVYVFVPVGPSVEGFGQTYIEALASGVPSIFTKAGVAHEIIAHGENAWVVDYENAGQIQVAMRALLDDPGLRDRLIRGGLRTVEPGFGISLHVARLDSLYRSLVTKQPVGQASWPVDLAERLLEPPTGQEACPSG
jgi:glycosyltransferase involved in cell wall biosynthesis